MLPITPGIPTVSLKKVSQFGPAVWPGIANIYIYTNLSKELYYLEF